MENASGGISITSVLISAICGYVGYTHPFWGMSAIPSALVAALLGPIAIGLAFLVVVGIVAVPIIIIKNH